MQFSFRNARIGTRLGLVFSLLVLLMVLATGYSAIKLKQTTSTLKRLSPPIVRWRARPSCSPAHWRR